MIHKIAVISDTHGMLRENMLEALKDAELVLHGGDICSRKTLEALQQAAEVTAVRGNGDGEWGGELPKERLLSLYGKKIYMIHNKKQMSELAAQADILLYGHSHKYEEKREDGRLWLNPGCCGPRRFGKAATMAYLMLDDETGEVRTEKIELTEGRKEPEKDAEADLRGTAELVVKELQRGKSVQEIARTHGIEEKLAEQIGQIYYTHPGIDISGILNRMEIAGL